MIQKSSPSVPPFNDSLYQALSQYPQHSLDHYIQRPLMDLGMRMKLGLPDKNMTIPKSFNVRPENAAR